MATSTTAAAVKPEDTAPDYEQAAAEALHRSPCVRLALQMPNVDLRLIAAIYKAGFSDGCMYGITEFRQSCERSLAAMASGTAH
jgi:hypothetical protein